MPTSWRLANAMYRPGASRQIDEFAGRKRGEIEWTLWHPLLEPFLGSTFGIIAFQEQVMQTCKAIGGFTGPQADFMRKAISKLYRLGKEEAQKEMQPVLGDLAARLPGTGHPARRH